MKLLEPNGVKQANQVLKLLLKDPMEIASVYTIQHGLS